MHKYNWALFELLRVSKGFINRTHIIAFSLTILYTLVQVYLKYVKGFIPPEGVYSFLIVLWVLMPLFFFYKDVYLVLKKYFTEVEYLVETDKITINNDEVTFSEIRQSNILLMNNKSLLFRQQGRVFLIPVQIIEPDLLVKIKRSNI